MESAGLEPAISGLQDQRLPNLASSPKLLFHHIKQLRHRDAGEYVRPPEILSPQHCRPLEKTSSSIEPCQDHCLQMPPHFDLFPLQPNIKQPQLADSESAVLPLDDLPISNNQSRRWESNPHPAAYETAATAFKLRRRMRKRVMGLEPILSSLEDWRAAGCASLADAATKG